MRRIPQLPQWIDFIWLSLIVIYVLAGVNLVPFHGDESTLTYMGRDYYYHFVEGDMSKVTYDERWSISPSEQHLRLLNGTVPKYLFGWITYVSGNAIEGINGQWDWGTDYRSNNNRGNIPTEALLSPARTVSAIQLAIALALFFGIARLVFNRPIAYLASLYLTLNPAILINGRRAMMEGSHLLGMILVIFAGLLLIHQRKWWQFIILGLVSGFALAAKHPNAIVIALIFIACTSYVIIQSIRENKTLNRQALQFVGVLSLSGLLALVVFYGMNPAWWGAPLERASEVLTLRNELLDLQIQQFDTYFTLSDQINGLLNFVFVAQPQYYEVPTWSLYPQITDQIQAYESSLWSGFAIGGSQTGGLLVAVLMLFGVVHLFRNTTINAEFRWLILLWGIGITVITFMLTPLEWQRYYLPIYPFVGLMLAYAVYTIANTILKRFSQ